MGLSRRNVLVGLGTALAGAGAAIGTGAFSTVSATRTVNVSVAGDGGGFLSLTAENTDYVNIPAGQAMVINLDGSGGSASGLNVDAVTTIDPLFSATNNGSDGIGFSVTADTADSNISISNNTIQNSVGNGTIGFRFYDADASDDPSIVANPRDIAVGNTMNVGLEIDTTGISDADNITDSNLLSSITLNAETGAYSGSS